GGDDPTRFDAVFLASQDTGAAAFRPREGWSGGRLFNDPLLGRRAPRLRATLSGYVAERLPNHLHPSRSIFLERIPTRPGAKIGTRVLAALGDGQTRPISTCSSTDLPSAMMADLWRAVIGCDDVSADADFFALGGHSLLAARLAGVVRREFGVDLPVLKIFEL